MQKDERWVKESKPTEDEGSESKNLVGWDCRRLINI